jgi:cytochrome c oxidase subunit 1
MFAWNIYRCAKGGKQATAEVWEGSHGLEWTVPSPAPLHTFDTPPVIK